MSELLVFQQRPGEEDSAPWILDRHGQRTEGHDDGRRSEELQRGLSEHPAVRFTTADTGVEDAERIVGMLHEAHYVELLKRIDWEQPRLLPELAPPGLPADSPVWAGVVKTAFEGMRTAVAGGQAITEGARFAYAVSRPPGHHAGPAWMGGYCYLNTAAAAAQAMLDRHLGPVAILDLDFHFPTGTRAMVERMKGVRLHSLHASTLEQVPWRALVPSKHERFVDFTGEPTTDAYIGELRSSLAAIASSCSALVLSLGYDILGGDPHGTWSFPPEIFTEIGRSLAECGLPMCVVQEGGYAVDALAECAQAFASGLLQDRGASRITVEVCGERA